MAERIRIEGLDELERRLRATESTLDHLDTTIEAVMREAQGNAATYPPSTEANSPSDGRWYERGYGTKWQTKTGVHGKRTSETLSKKWYVKGSSKLVEVGNTASYSNYVHGDEQTDFHGRRGWRKLYDVLSDAMPKLEDSLRAVVEKALEGNK